MNLGITNKTRSPKPPERGAFPLDHIGECVPILESYKGCLAEHSSVTRHCRDLAEQYLKCRMDRGLMRAEDSKNLGFGITVPDPITPPSRKAEEGFVAGTERVPLASAQRRSP